MKKLFLGNLAVIEALLKLLLKVVTHPRRQEEAKRLKAKNIESRRVSEKYHDQMKKIQLLRIKKGFALIETGLKNEIRHWFAKPRPMTIEDYRAQTVEAKELVRKLEIELAQLKVVENGENVVLFSKSQK